MMEREVNKQLIYKIKLTALEELTITPLHSYYSIMIAEDCCELF
jgi:hypothetical protein